MAKAAGTKKIQNYCACYTADTKGLALGNAGSELCLLNCLGGYQRTCPWAGARARGSTQHLVENDLVVSCSNRHDLLLHWVSGSKRPVCEGSAA
jgi:hypothetical protein